MEKPFWLVFSGHYVFHWHQNAVSVYVPKMTTPHAHTYKVAKSPDTFVAVAPDTLTLSGFSAGPNPVLPDPGVHFCHPGAGAVTFDIGAGRIHAQIDRIPRPNSISVLAGRTVPADAFRNGMAPNSVASSTKGSGRYTMADTTVWEYPVVSEPPTFKNGHDSITALDLGAAYALVFVTQMNLNGHNHERTTQQHKGANDIICYNGRLCTTFRFVEEVADQHIFQNFDSFPQLSPFFPKPDGQFLRGGIPMGSCDQDNGGPP
jgi:hypothetical protein